MKLRLLFDNRPFKQHRQPAFFNSFRLPSSFLPKLDAEVERELESWVEGLLSKANRLHSFEPRPTGPFYIRKALTWLRANRQSICKISADKGYGPAYISAEYISKHHMKEIESGAFTEITSSQYMWSHIATYDYLQAVCDQAVMNRLIDIGTLKFILHPFQDMGLPTPRKSALPAVMSCLGRIRYLVKLHKPGCKLRRVEVDTKSPFNNLTLFVSSILRQITAICDTTVVDSKQVLLDLIDQPPPLETTNPGLVIVAADLEDSTRALIWNPCRYRFAPVWTRFMGRR